MSLSPQDRKEVDMLPPGLREILDAELAAGNSIVEIGHSFPAPPVGAYFKLARPVTTRLRQSDAAISFYDRNSSIYSGEFTDARRFYFILEPPNPPPEEVDMDAIREELRARQSVPPQTAETRVSRHLKDQEPATPAPRKGPDSAVERFRASMQMNYERWREGTSYDLDLLKTASPAELVEIETLLLQHGVTDWRDVEALAALDSPRARALLRETLLQGDPEYAAAVLRFAPQLANDKERIVTLVTGLERTDFYAGLTETLQQVAQFHPPEIIAALLRGVLQRSGQHACHFAAMLMFLHGQASSSFDWELRPFFLKFNTEDMNERRTMFKELCARIGVAPELFLHPE